MKRLIALLMALLLALGVADALAAEDISIMLIGTDDLGEELSKTQAISRADAMYVLHLNAQNNKVKLLGIERDYQVEMPDGSGPNKLATSTYFGGPELCVTLVNDLLRLNLKHYIHIELKSLVEAVNAIGGIDMQVYDDELTLVNKALTAAGHPRLRSGMAHLDGDQVLAFVQVRDVKIDKIDSNIDRNARHQRVIEAGLDKLHQLSLSDLLALFDVVLPYIHTDITVSDLVPIAQQFIKMPFDTLDYARSPMTASSLQRVDVHQLVVLDDQAAEIEAVKAFLEQ